MTTAIVVAGGPAPDIDITAHLPPGDLVVVADSGLDHALTLGLTPTLVVGDLDSISEQGLVWIEHHGPTVQAHPVDKDQTDLDLAVTAAANLAERLVVVDSGAGRLDHSLANLLLLASDRFAHVDITAFVADGLVTVVRNVRSLSGGIGDVVTLVAMGGRASGVSTKGLRWALDAAMLEPGTTWGVSNEFSSTTAEVTVTDGVVLAVQPERPAADDGAGP